jgi:hypothetical protein
MDDSHIQAAIVALLHSLGPLGTRSAVQHLTNTVGINTITSVSSPVPSSSSSSTAMPLTVPSSLMTSAMNFPITSNTTTVATKKEKKKRKEYSPQLERHGRPWTTQELKVLQNGRTDSPAQSFEQLAATLKRTEQSVRSMWRQVKSKKRKLKEQAETEKSDPDKTDDDDDDDDDDDEEAEEEEKEKEKDEKNNQDNADKTIVLSQKLEPKNLSIPLVSQTNVSL